MEHRIFMCSCMLVAQLCLTVCHPMDYSLASLLCPWNSQAKNTGMGCHDLLQEIFPTQGLNISLNTVGRTEFSVSVK